VNSLAVVASLTDQPYLLSMDQIAELTDYQIWRIYGKERDDRGVPKTIPGSLAPSKRESGIVEAKAKYLSMGVALGISMDELNAAWSKKNGGRN